MRWVETVKGCGAMVFMAAVMVLRRNNPSTKQMQASEPFQQLL